MFGRCLCSLSRLRNHTSDEDLYAVATLAWKVHQGADRCFYSRDCLPTIIRLPERHETMYEDELTKHDAKSHGTGANMRYGLNVCFLFGCKDVVACFVYSE
jgi:hypothetical protein